MINEYNHPLRKLNVPIVWLYRSPFLLFRLFPYPIAKFGFACITTFIMMELFQSQNFSFLWHEKVFFWQKNLHLSLSFEEQNEFDLHYPSFSFTKKKEPKKRVQSIQKQNCSVAELLPLEIIMSFYKNEVYALGISDTPKIKIQKYCWDLNKTQV